MSFDFLFATPTFTRGMGRAIDFWGTSDLYNVSRSPETADALAMWSDWKDVGSDLLTAIRSATDQNTSRRAAA